MNRSRFCQGGGEFLIFQFVGTETQFLVKMPLFLVQFRQKSPKFLRLCPGTREKCHKARVSWIPSRGMSFGAELIYSGKVVECFRKTEISSFGRWGGGSTEIVRPWEGDYPSSAKLWSYFFVHACVLQEKWVVSFFSRFFRFLSHSIFAMNRTQWGVLIILCVQNTTIMLSMRYVLTRSKENEEFIHSTTVVCVEFTKLVASFLVFLATAPHKTKSGAIRIVFYLSLQSLLSGLSGNTWEGPVSEWQNSHICAQFVYTPLYRFRGRTGSFPKVRPKWRTNERAVAPPSFAKPHVKTTGASLSRRERIGTILEFCSFWCHRSYSPGLA